MKKLTIIATAISLISGAAYAFDPAIEKLQSYRDMLKRYDKECQIPTFGSLFVSRDQINGCKDLIHNMNTADEVLRKYYNGTNQNAHHGPAREFWNNQKYQK